MESYSLALPHWKLAYERFNVYTNSAGFAASFRPAVIAAFQLLKKPYNVLDSHGLVVWFNFNSTKSKVHEQFTLYNGRLSAPRMKTTANNALLAAFLLPLAPFTAYVNSKAVSNSDYTEEYLTIAGLAEAYKDDEHMKHRADEPKGDVNWVRLPIVVSADLASGRLPGAKRGGSTGIYMTHLMDHDDFEGLVDSLADEPVELVPSLHYDWVEAFQRRLSGDGVNPPEFMLAREEARAREKKEFVASNGPEARAAMEQVWEKVIEVRDSYDWNPNED